jgi:hypothetical protein
VSDGPFGDDPRDEEAREEEARDEESPEERLRFALQVLAAPFEEQREVNSASPTQVADFATDFDEARRLAAAFMSLGQDERGALFHLDQALQQVGDACTLDALRRDPVWEQVRDLAALALDAFDWPLDDDDDFDDDGVETAEELR